MAAQLENDLALKVEEQWLKARKSPSKFAVSRTFFCVFHFQTLISPTPPPVDHWDEKFTELRSRITCRNINQEQLLSNPTGRKQRTKSLCCCRVCLVPRCNDTFCLQKVSLSVNASWRETSTPFAFLSSCMAVFSREEIPEE